MNRRLTSLTTALIALLGAEVATAAPELKVCVEVTLRAPPQADEVSRPTIAAAATAPAPQDTPATPAASSNANGKSSTQAKPSVASIDFAAELDKLQANQAPTEAPKSQPRVHVVSRSDVSAEDAASMASEVDPQGSSDPHVVSGAHLPLGQTPTVYLKRLIEHFVTHEQGFIASQNECAQTVTVELYPLKVGWTAFARYSGTGREERVDQLLPTELSQFAERSVLALLHDVPIGMTVDRDNVLWSDSLKSTQRIRGRGHLMLGVGTR
ncbi:MAG TPA: hypothetical protein VIV60_23620, partial [Polyangiaceae bacterium]